MSDFILFFIIILAIELLMAFAGRDELPTHGEGGKDDE